jgi:diacylglycerol kinase (ATP)
MKIVAIVNPVAGKGQEVQEWPRLLEAFGPKAAQVATWWTEGPGQAEILAAQARREGFDRVIAVGGDGTLFEVANGLWWEPQGRMPSLGMVPFGTGCDYLRNFEVGGSLKENLTAALGETEVPVNLGLAHLPGLDGALNRRVFVNVLGLGFDAEVVNRFQRQRRFLRGKIAYISSALEELVRLKLYRLQGEANGVAIDAMVHTFVVGLGRYFGGGILIAPQAAPQSDSFQLVWVQQLSRPQALRLLPALWTGRQLSHPQVCASHAGHLKLVATPVACVQAEGELIGRSPIEVKLTRRAFNFAAISAKHL